MKEQETIRTQSVNIQLMHTRMHEKKHDSKSIKILKLNMGFTLFPGHTVSFYSFLSPIIIFSLHHSCFSSRFFSCLLVDRSGSIHCLVLAQGRGIFSSTLICFYTLSLLRPFHLPLCTLSLASIHVSPSMADARAEH